MASDTVPRKMSLLLSGIARLSQALNTTTSFERLPPETPSRTQLPNQPLDSSDPPSSQYVDEIVTDQIGEQGSDQLEDVQTDEKQQVEVSDNLHERSTDVQVTEVNQALSDEQTRSSAPSQVEKPEFDVIETAQRVCAVRALECDREESDMLYDDYLAETLAGEELMKSVREKKNESSSTRIALRTRYFDDFITESVEDMIEHDIHNIQIVIVGSGMDTRAYRLPIMAMVSKVFEVDFEKVLELKERLLETVEPAHPLPLVQDGAVHLVMADVEREDWVDALLSHGFDSRIPSVWVLEGLLYYFEASKVEELLGEIGRLCVSGISTIGFSAISQMTFASGRVGMKNFKSAMPDPQKTLEKAGFTTNHIDVYKSVRINFGRFADEELIDSEAWQSDRHGIYVTATKM